MKLTDSLKGTLHLYPRAPQRELGRANMQTRFYQVMTQLIINKRRDLTIIRGETCQACSWISFRSFWVNLDKRNKIKQRDPFLRGYKFCSSFCIYKLYWFMEFLSLELLSQSLSPIPLKAESIVFLVSLIQRFTTCFHFSRNLSHVCLVYLCNAGVSNPSLPQLPVQIKR